MSLNGSGVAVINSAGQPVVATTLITVAAMNALTADIATMISTCLMKDGQQTVMANIPFNNYKLTGVGDGTALQDAATLKNVQNGAGVYVGTVGGTADAVTLTPSPAITAYAAGQTFRFIASGANTTNVTVAVSGLVAKALTKNGTTALVAGDIPSSTIVAITYDGTRFILGTTGAATVPTGALPLSLIDVAGDLIYGTVDNTAARLAIGTARQQLNVNAGATAPAWASSPHSLMIGTGDMLISSSANTPARLAIGTARQVLEVNIGSSAPAWADRIILGTSVVPSGTTVTFTGIPAAVKRVTMSIIDVSTNGTSVLRVRIGDVGGINISGYAGGVSSNAAANIWVGTGAGIDLNIASVAAGTYSGVVILILVNAASWLWSVHGLLARTDSLGTVWSTTGYHALSNVLTQIQLGTVNGVDTFDAGEVNITYE